MKFMDVLHRQRKRMRDTEGVKKESKQANEQTKDTAIAANIEADLSTGEQKKEKQMKHFMNDDRLLFYRLATIYHYFYYYYYY